MYKIVQADVIEWAANYKGKPFHAILTDPSYGWKFMNREWDSDIALKSETWMAIARHLYPGGFIFAFGGPKTYHRLACALEDAGLRLWPPIVHLQSQGFPKSTRIDTQIDRAAGKFKERQIERIWKGGQRSGGMMGKNLGTQSRNITAPATELARIWEGHRYGLQALKPCTEIVAIARKPLTNCAICDKLVLENKRLMEVFLCQFINAKDAEQNLSEHGLPQSEASQNSVPLTATLISLALSPHPREERMVIFRSQVEESIILNIVSLWNNILDAALNHGNMCTTSTASETITVLKILKSWLLTNIPHYTLRAALGPSGVQLDAKTARENSGDLPQSCENIQMRFAQGNVSGHTDSSTNPKPANSAEKSSQIPPQDISALLSAFMKVKRSREEWTYLARSAVLFLESLLGQLKTSSTIGVGPVGKSGVEFVAIAQKPYEGKPVESIVETGAGALWIDGGRIATNNKLGSGGEKHCSFENKEGWDRPWMYDSQKQKTHAAKIRANVQHAEKLGRWPPNFALTHIAPYQKCQGKCQSIHPMQPVIEVCPGCGGELEFVEGCKRVGVKRVKGTNLHGKPSAGKDTDKQAWGLRYNLHTDYADPDGYERVADWQCVKDCPVERLGEQSGVSESRSAVDVKRFGRSGGIMGKQGGLRDGRPEGHNDKGTCTRYYHQSGWEYECVEKCPVRKLNEDAGERKSGGANGHRMASPNLTMSGPNYERITKNGLLPSSGPASRFYHNSDFSHETAERLAQEEPVKYCPKAAKRERNEGLDDFYWKRDKQSPTGFVRVSEEEWEKLDKRERARGNIHPTVKPLSLLEWLATLLLPPKEYMPRRLLVTFSGSGSEVCAAILAGWEEIEAVEILQDYVDISQARCRFWAQQSKQLEMAL